MARLSLWKNNKHSKDYMFFDRRISEMFTLGGTGVLVHKYLGPNPQGNYLTTNVAQITPNNILGFADTSSINIGDAVQGIGIPAGATVIAKDASTVTISANTNGIVGIGVSIGFSSNPAVPAYTNQSAQNIQDLLFLENRDRKYDRDVYTMRGIYTVADQDFDLSQFGLFLATGTLFMVFHLNDMVEMLGRKIMNGDVLELQHLTDFDALNQDVPAALKRFFVVSDTSWAGEGYSPTWWPHLWRAKINPLVDSQEYKDIINNLTAADGVTPIGNILSTLDISLGINDATIAEATANVPKSGYNVAPFFVKPLDDNGQLIEGIEQTADDILNDASDIVNSSDEGTFSPTATVKGYMTGDGLAPNGLPVKAGIVFPDSPAIGDYALRTDYLPNRLFRFDGRRWIMIEDAQRTDLTKGANNKTQLGTFVNNTDTYTDAQGHTHPQKQSLSKGLTPLADN